MLLGIDDPARLRKFFEAKAHRSLVVRVADAMEMGADDQALLLELLDRLGRSAPPHDTVTGRIQRAGQDGYILLPMAHVCQMSLEDLQAVQVMLCGYHEVRERKGEPSAQETCDCTDGGQRRPDPQCNSCSGTGLLWVLQEMSAEEVALAEGAANG
ncbi:MAG: hypothetical protein MUC88_00455 [Planctomycetes bacterium]|jgi:hypothetical protein|nr:hypothetical protein [Planctomycetota bacterium]